MGASIGKPLPRSPVPAGKLRICVSGFGMSHHTGRARSIADLIVKTYPDVYETWFYFDSKGYRPDFLESVKAELPEDQQKAFKHHNSSPFCWLEKPDGAKTALGGRDRFCEWVQDNFKDKKGKDAPFLKLCASSPSVTEAWFDTSTPGTAKTE